MFFISADIMNFINSYLFLILLIFFIIIHLSLIFGNKNYLKFSNSNRKQIILWFSILLLISNIIFMSIFLMREINDNFKWSFDTYFIFNYAELCTFLGFFGAIILIISSSLSMTNYEEIVTRSSSLSIKKEKNSSKTCNLIIESIGP